MKSHRLLLLTAFIISGCSLCYELIIGAISSYISGDTVWQYSITIGLYMAAMGLGSYLSKYIKTYLYDWFIGIELAVGVIGGISALAIFLGNLYIVSYQLIMYLLVISIGCLVGMEIPLLARIIELDTKDVRITLSSVFAFDYIGGLVGAVAFPLLLLPYLGYMASAFLCGLLNITAAAIVVIRYQHHLHFGRTLKLATIAIALSLTVGLVASESISKYIENGLYRDTIVFSQQSQYQKVIITRHKDDIRLFIDGNLQFSSMDEYRYHEALVHIPMAQVVHPKNILILGGGDGLAARELLKYKDVNITLVDLDVAMTEVSKTNPLIAELNQGSLSDERVHIINDDAFKYLEHTTERYDLIIVDLPDPNNAALGKLYSNIFYRLCYNALSESGALVVQSTSPYYAPKVFWSINKTLASEGFFVYPYHVQVPTFGEWGFNMATKHELSQIKPITAVDTRYITPDIMAKLFTFGRDEKVDDVEISSITRPVIIDYYIEATKKWR